MAVLFLWILAFLVLGAVMGINLYALICLSDLQADLINPHDCAGRINKLVMPEIIAHAAAAGLMLLCGSWSMVLVNGPLIAWHVRQIGRNQHLADVTEIFNHLDKEKSVRMGKAMLYALVFLTAAYRGTERGGEHVPRPGGEGEDGRVLQGCGGVLGAPLLSVFHRSGGEEERVLEEAPWR